MESIESILKAAAAQGADKDTLWKLEITLLIRDALKFILELEKTALDHSKAIVKLHERLEALEWDHDHLAEAFLNVEEAVFPEEAA